MNPYLVVLIAYSLALIALGLALSRKVLGSSDFFVAGRNLDTRLLFSTLLAANIGAGSTIGAAGLGFAIGLSGWWWVGSAGFGSLILAVTVGPKIWEIAARQGFLTVGDFLEFRFGASVRVTVAVLLCFGTLSILAGQLIAFSWILSVVAGTPKWVGCSLGGIVVCIYFIAGGLKGTAWINLVQLTVKGFGFLVGLPIALSAVGGWHSLETKLISTGVRTENFFSFTGIGWTEILSYVVLLAPSFIVSPGLLQKIYGARSAAVVRRGVGANAIALLLFSFLPVTFGMIAAASFPDLGHQEMALPMVITELLPFWLGAVLLAAVFSAEISSADAILFMLSTSLSKDLYQRFLRPDMNDAQLLKSSRWIAGIAGLAGISLAFFLESVISALSIFYGLLSVALFAPVVVGLYRANPGGKACLVAILISVFSTAGFHVLTTGEGYGIVSTTGFGIALSLFLLLVTAVPRREGLGTSN